MTIIVHWRECAIERGRSKQPVRCAHWAEYGFAPMELAAWRDDRGYGHFRAASTGVPVTVPIGSRVVRRGENDRLVTHFDPYGLTPESVAWLAVRGQRGFGIPEEAFVGKKKRAPGQAGLWADADEGPGAYGSNGTAVSPAPGAITAEESGVFAATMEVLGEPVVIVTPPSVAPGAVRLPWQPSAEQEMAAADDARDRLKRIASEVVAEYREADAKRIAELEEAVRRAIRFHHQEMFESARTVLESAITLESTP